MSTEVLTAFSLKLIASRGSSGGSRYIDKKICRIRSSWYLGRRSLSFLPPSAVHVFPSMYGGSHLINRNTKGWICRYCSSLTNTGKVKEWHNPNFLSTASLDDKEQWLEYQLQSRYAKDFIDTEAFLIVLRDLAQSKEGGAARSAETWMNRFQSMSVTNISHRHQQPNVECYLRLIQAWGNAEKENAVIAVKRAEKWLHQIENNKLKPNTECYNAFLDACTRGRGYKTNPNITSDHADKAESTLMYMIEQQKQFGENSSIVPNTDSYNYVIRGWTRCKNRFDIGKRAMKLLKEMEFCYQNDPIHTEIRPNTKSFTMVMCAFASVAKQKVHRNSNFRSDPSRNGLIEIQQLYAAIERMHALSENEGRLEVAPNTASYNTLLSALASISGDKHPSAPLEAERVFRGMIASRRKGHVNVSPDSISFLQLMRAWSKSGVRHAGERASFWLDKQWAESDAMTQGVERDNFSPNTEAYITVARAWMRTGEPQKTECLLLDLLERNEKANSPQLQPNSVLFSTVIQSWLNVAENSEDISERADALQKSVHWLEYLIELEQEREQLGCPYEIFAKIIRVAQKSAFQERKSLDLAVRVFEMLRSSRHQMDCSAYTKLLCVVLLGLSRPENDEERTLLITKLVTDCCDDGYISGSFLRMLTGGPVYYHGWTLEESARLAEKLFPDWPLPPSWVRHVHEKKRPRFSDLKRKCFRLFTQGLDPYLDPKLDPYRHEW